jgi:hypothetical protein
MPRKLLVTLQVRMSPDMLFELNERAQSLGFTSVPGYVRHWAAAEIRQPAGRELALNEPCKIAINYIELVLARRYPLPPNVDQALECISLHLRRRAFSLQFGPKYTTRSFAEAGVYN